MCMLHNNVSVYSTTDLSFGPPRPVARRHPNRAKPVDGDAEDRVDGTQACRVVEQQGG